MVKKQRVKLVEAKNRFNIVSLTDWHVPFEDPQAIELAFKFCKKVQPEIIIVHEAHDFYSLSRFDKNPARRFELQDEIDAVTVYFKRLKELCPKSRIILLDSNHLARLKKYLWTQAPALSGLRSLDIKTLLGLEELDIEFMDDFEFKGFLFKHGSIVRQDSSYTAKAEYLREGMSGASGHTHRLGQHFATKRGGSYVWLESGCLCLMDAEYIVGTANWQQGLSMVSFKKMGKRVGKRFDAKLFPIIDNEIML